MTATGRALRLAERTPAWLLAGAGALAAEALSFRPPRPVRQWQVNAMVATGQAPSRRQTAGAIRSWARNLGESAQLAHWSAERVADTIIISDEDRARLLGAHRDGGAVVALPHMGSWDLAGAWACGMGMPVSTVAEQIPEFDYFVAARQRIGMKVHGHRAGHLVPTLAEDLRAGHLVCLLSDRKLGSGGTPVEWPTPTGPLPVRLPAGAATIALQTGATLLGIACHYEERKMRLVVSPAITPAAHADPVTSLNQQLADFFASQVSSNPVDWHMLQRFFPHHEAS